VGTEVAVIDVVEDMELSGEVALHDVGRTS
jgi:hypothetical protein